MTAVDLADDGRKLPSVLALLVISIRIAASAGIAGGIVSATYEHGRNTDKTVRVQVGWKTQRTERIGVPAWIVVEDQFRAAGETKVVVSSKVGLKV